MRTALKKILLFGRANVGKSTLFNKLSGKNSAIVYDHPGVTRDRREIPAQLGGFQFLLIDAPGFEHSAKTPLSQSMRAQLQQGVLEANIILFMIDIREGLTDEDLHAAQWLRKQGGNKPIVLLANKAESSSYTTLDASIYKLGFGDPVLISAEHKLGFSELYDRLQSSFPQDNLVHIAPSDSDAFEDEHSKETRIDIAILGRPNVGKSTLFNKLIGQERSITGDQPGLTRDAIDYSFPYKNYTIRLVDTAGLRRKSKITEDLEQLSVKETLRSIRFCQIALLVIDAQTPLEKQDLLIAQHILEEGRGLIILLNKWDLIAEKTQKNLLQSFQEKLERTLPQIKGVEFLPISALQNTPTNQIFQSVLNTYKIWDQRIPTAKLNQFLKIAVTKHFPPLVKGKQINIKYMTQIKRRPPTFVLFLSKPEELPTSYLQYILNQMRDTFNLRGTPIRLLTRSGKNPYVSSS